MHSILDIGSTHALHMWLGIPIMIRLFYDEYDPSGRVWHSPETRSLGCGIIVCAILVTYIRNPARRLSIDEDEDEIITKKGFFSRLQESLTFTISSSSSSMFRNALFISILFAASWPQNKATIPYAVATGTCDAEDQECHTPGPMICNLKPSYCDSKSQNWIYEQGGTAQAYKPGAPLSKTVCNPEEIRDKKTRHKVATWPYSRSGRKNPPELKMTLNLLRCSKDQQLVSQQQAEEEEGECCCSPLIGPGSGQNATVEVWQSRPDGTYSSLRAGSDEGECRAKWLAIENPDTDPLLEPPSTVEFQTMAPGSTGILSGLGPGGWEFYPYGPPVIHILVRPGVDGISPLLVDVPVGMHYQTLEKQPFTWRDWRGPAWVKSGGNPEQPAFNITSWEPNVDKNSVSLTIDLFLKEDKDYSLSYTTSPKLMCPSLFYGMPSSFFLEPISVCGKYLLDYFDL